MDDKKCGCGSSGNNLKDTGKKTGPRFDNDQLGENAAGTHGGGYANKKTGGK